MLRLLFTMSMLLISGVAISCQYPIPKSFQDEIQTASQIYVFRLDSLAQVKDRVLSDKRGPDGKFGPAVESDEYMGRVAGKIKIVRVLRGAPRAQFITFSTSSCGGLRLDVGHYFLVATSANSIVLTPVSGDESILDFNENYSEYAETKVNERSYILRNVLAFINGKQLPSDFPDYETRRFTQPMTSPAPRQPR
jgi:hypothetical protein